MIAILKGKDRHTVRLTSGLDVLGKDYEVITQPDKLNGRRFDIAFVDPSFNYDVSGQLKADRILFYDTEDGVRDFHKGVAWNTIQCSHYAKMNYIEGDRGKNIKSVGFPLSHSINLKRVATELLRQNFSVPFHPFFIGTPTYLGKNNTNKGVNYRSYPALSINPLADNGVYNQRFDWIASLIDSKIPADVGVVFPKSNNNYSLAVQQDWHGKGVARLGAKSKSYLDQLRSMVQLGLALCPTGHERLSWRTFDIMATGAIMFITDFDLNLSTQ